LNETGVAISGPNAHYIAFDEGTELVQKCYVWLRIEMRQKAPDTVGIALLVPPPSADVICGAPQTQTHTHRLISLKMKSNG
jgi:hypothetical protein